MPDTSTYKLRAPCRYCGGTTGYLVPKGGQNCVYCGCGRLAYNAPKVETGEATRSITSVHEALRPKQKARILERATARCELCGNAGIVHVSHLLSVKDGMALGLTEAELNSDENLACLCECCNLGMGDLSFSPRLYIALLQRRLRG